MLLTFKDDILMFDVKPKTGKRHIYKESVKGDELIIVRSFFSIDIFILLLDLMADFCIA